MGIIKNGILGAVSGAVGPVVGSSWKGVANLRSRPVIRKPPSIAQLEQRTRFAVASRFLVSMKELLNISYGEFTNKMTGPNSAQSYTLKNAVTGIYPDLKLDYSLVLVSRGSLPNAINPVAVSTMPGKIHYNWIDNSGTGKAKPKDKSILVAYCEQLNQSVHAIGGMRSAGSDILDASFFSGRKVQTWLAFITENGNDIASSFFTGELNVI